MGHKSRNSTTKGAKEFCCSTSRCVESHIFRHKYVIPLWYDEKMRCFGGISSKFLYFLRIATDSHILFVLYLNEITYC